jgi:hypothetical protein
MLFTFSDVTRIRVGHLLGSTSYSIAISIIGKDKSIGASLHRANFYRKSLVRYDHILNRAMNSN